MCITSTARRRSLTLHVLPSHLLLSASPTAGSDVAASKGNAAASEPAAALSPAVTSSSPLMMTTSPKPEPEIQTRPLPTSQVKKPSNKKSRATKGNLSSPPNNTHPSHHHLPHHDGLVVQHHYHDHAADPTIDPALIKHKAKGGVIIPFPVKLHDMLDKIEADGLASVVSWQPHGRCFVVHKPREFVDTVMPRYFKQTKMASFQRQLNLYGFNRLTGGLDKGGYYHEMFLRGKVSLAYDIHRMRVKGTGVRLPTNPDNEPNFYALPPVTKSDPHAPLPFRPEAAPALPPLPPPQISSAVEVAAALSADAMATRRAELLKQSRDHSRKIEQGRRMRQGRRMSQTDVVFFEGLPFHYLDPSALPSRAERRQYQQPQQQSQPSPSSQPQQALQQPQRPPFPSAKARPTLAHSSSIVSDSSESEGSNGRDDALLPSFSPSNMDWAGPLSSLRRPSPRRTSLQARTSSGLGDLADAGRPIEEDIEGFFRGFDMPVDMYHDQIDRMGDDDDTAFGYLLERAITE